jgi:4-amino-4-deoxy-L-arabinose transferase-like glycosyltransferase
MTDLTGSRVATAERNEPAAPAREPAPRVSRFFAILAVIAVAACGLRVAYVMTVTRHDHKFYDAVYYQLQAQRLADGHGYTDPFLPIIDPHSKPVPSADHPPMAVFVLTPVAWAFGHSSLAMRFEMVLLGTGTVVAIGLLGRELGGDATGLAAAGIAAVYPELWVNDGLIMSETICALAVTVALLLTYRLVRRPSWGRAAAVGIMCGIAALTRAELLLLAPLLGLWFLFTRRFDRRAMRVGTAVITVGAAALTIAPWFLYNQTRFDNTVIMSTNDGGAMLGSNCDAVYHGNAIGLTNLVACLPAKPPHGDQSVVSRAYVKKALHYMGDHKGQAAVVVAARIGRDWSVFRPQDMVTFNKGEGRPPWVTIAGLAFYYPLVVLAVAGVVVLARRKRVWWPLVAPAVVVVLSAVLSYGQTRFRISAEPSIVVLAAVAIVAGAARVRGRPSPLAPITGPEATV